MNFHILCLSYWHSLWSLFPSFLDLCLNTVLGQSQHELNGLVYDNIVYSLQSLSDMQKILTLLNLNPTQATISVRKWVNNITISDSIQPSHFQVSRISLGKILSFSGVLYIVTSISSPDYIWVQKTFLMAGHWRKWGPRVEQTDNYASMYYPTSITLIFESVWSKLTHQDATHVPICDKGK